MRYSKFVPCLLAVASLAGAGCLKYSTSRGVPACDGHVSYETRSLARRLFVSEQTCSFSFRGSTGDSIGIAVVSTTEGFDPVIKLVGPTVEDSSGSLKEDNDGCSYPNSGMIYELSQDGYYEIRVSSDGENTHGSFKLTLCENCDPCHVAGLATGDVAPL